MMSKHKFKETEIGLIPENWGFLPINKIDPSKGTVQTGPFGSLLHSYDYSKEGVPLLLVKNIVDGRVVEHGIPRVNFKKADELKKFWLKEGDIVFTRVGAVGRTLYITKDIEGWMFSGQTLRLRIENPEINNKYVEYYFRTPQYQAILEMTSLGSTRASINTSILANTHIPIPPKPEQDKIAEIISNLDEKIYINNQMNQTLEEIGQAIFRHWFAHFEFPYENGQPYKSSGGEMGDSEVGEIPVGWEIKKLKNICSITMGQSPKSEFYNEEGKGLPFHQGVTNFGKRFPTDKMFCTVENKIAEYGDILFSVRAPVGRINIAKSKIVIGRGLSAIRHEKDFQSFLLYQLKNIFTEEDSMGSGTVFNAITRKDLDDLKVLVPNEEVDKQFNDFVSPMEKKIENLILENDNLTKIRDSLLPKLMTGKIRVVR